jgi:hypothetical protein
MKNKVWVYRCCVMYFFLFKHQNTAENDHFYAVNSQVATLVVFTAGMWVSQRARKNWEHV